METRRIKFEDTFLEVRVDGDTCVAGDGSTFNTSEVQYLPPAEPTKILCVHLNHSSRVKEFQANLPPAPTYFQKPLSSLNVHKGDVIRPRGCNWLNYEGEIVIIVGKECRGIQPDQASEFIRGFTIGNDFGLHDFRDTDAGSMLRVKGSDSLCPVGPGLNEEWDFKSKQIRTYVNGEVVQDGNTDEMKWDMHYLVADLARIMTLNPGDMIFSGTPANSRPVEPGDKVEVEVEGLGKLENNIVEGDFFVDSDFGAQPSESEEVISTALGGDWEFRGIRPPQ